MKVESLCCTLEKTVHVRYKCTAVTEKLVMKLGYQVVICVKRISINNFVIARPEVVGV